MRVEEATDALLEAVESEMINTSSKKDEWGGVVDAAPSEYMYDESRENIDWYDPNDKIAIFDPDVAAVARYDSNVAAASLERQGITEYIP